MILSHIALSGFRGFRNPVRIDLSRAYTVIDGRNGTGKSTLCDAVEFALTGTISKYLDASSDRESVSDYIWWRGARDDKVDCYVEVGFDSASGLKCIRRTPSGVADNAVVSIAGDLVDVDAAPPEALQQVCSATIIRDEHIARLSLDLRDVERFDVLRAAIGASDSDRWIKKSSALVAAASARMKSAMKKREQASDELKRRVSSLDRSRAQITESAAIADAVSGLQKWLDSTAQVDELGDLGRKRLVDIGRLVELFQGFLSEWPEVDQVRHSLATLEAGAEESRSALVEKQAALAKCTHDLEKRSSSSDVSRTAHRLQQLGTLGMDIGLLDGHCPLCNSAIDSNQYQRGLNTALDRVRVLDEQAVELVTREKARDDAAEAVERARNALEVAVKKREAAQHRTRDFDRRLETAGLLGSNARQVAERVATLETERDIVSSHVRMLDTVAFNRVVATSEQRVCKSRERLEDAERKLGKARLAEERAKAIHDAVRRAAWETLDERLYRVLPLTSELYKRLRPHPSWEDIQYSIRGDVRRFLKLQVGEAINPQFVFSSGQRRATGLAFLLSVNLSLAWSRWQTLVLDDPVQHVDDFRAVHLAEVLGHLRDAGRQIVCAVEDSALADLMCRRLAGSRLCTGKRIRLGNTEKGEIGVLEERDVAPLIGRSLVQGEESLAG